MDKALRAILLALLAASSAAKAQILMPILTSANASAGATTWSLVQQANGGACTTTLQTCPITVSATGTSNLIVVVTDIPVASDFITAVSGGGTYVIPAGCQAVDTTRSTSCAYTLASTSGATTITVTRTTTTSALWRVWAFEAASTLPTITVDTGNPTGSSRAQSSAVTSTPGVTLTINGTSDLIVQTYMGGGAISAITGGTCSGTGLNSAGGYTIPYNANNQAIAVCGNTTSGTAPVWTNASSRAALGAIAFTAGP